MFKTKIILPDDQYIPENIDLIDKIFDNRKLAINHIEEQYDILTEWMIDDPSCNKKPILETSTINDCNNGNYIITLTIDNGECKCEFKVERLENANC